MNYPARAANGNPAQARANRNTRKSKEMLSFSRWYRSRRRGASSAAVGAQGVRVSVVGSPLCWDPAWSRETAPFPVPQAGWQREEKVLVVLCLLQQREGRRIFVCGGTRMSSCSIRGDEEVPFASGTQGALGLCLL